LQNKSLYYIFVATKNKAMFEFDQYLGFLAFLGILTLGFWLMIFLITFVVPYWIGGSLIERLNEIKEEKKAKREAEALKM
jgi:hypothetical protein